MYSAALGRQLQVMILSLAQGAKIVPTLPMTW